MMASVAGWYSDPTGKSELRYWDGEAWTERTKSRTAGNDSESVSAPKQQTGTKATKNRSEICTVGTAWRDTTSTDRRTRKDYPYEVWFVANALGPDGLYRACESRTWWNSSAYSYLQKGPVPWSYQYRGPGAVPRAEWSEASFNDLVKQLWEAGWEPTAGGALWYEYRFRRIVTD